MTFHLYCLSKSFQIPIIDKMTNRFPEAYKVYQQKTRNKKNSGLQSNRYAKVEYPV